MLDQSNYESDRSKNCLIESQVCERLQSEPCWLGIDEAGRGPVLGKLDFFNQVEFISTYIYVHIQIYAPTSEADEEDIEGFYNKLQDTIDKINKRDILIIMGDFNAKIGRKTGSTYNEIVGQYGLGEKNERGEKLEEFATENSLTVANTMFKHHKRRLYTWTSPDGKSRNQIDYIMIQTQWRTSVRNTKTLPGADCDSDHKLLMANIKIKLKYNKKETMTVRYDVTDIQESYVVEVKNKFMTLLGESEDKEPEELADNIKEIFKQTAEKHLKKREIKRQPWISQRTKAKIEERRKIKGRSDTKSKETYKALSKEIKKACRDDKDKYIIDKCQQIEEHSKHHNSREMFKEIKSLTSKFQPIHRVVKDSKGRVLTESNEIIERWREYCEQMYNPQVLSEERYDNTIYEIDEDNENREPLRSEIEWAIKNLKNGKSPGCDDIAAEMIKASGDAGVDVYHTLCKKIWHTGKWPEDWKRAVFIPIPKKGDAQECSNHRTISLISHASKIMLKILMKRIESKLEEEVSEAQAGFRRGRGTRDHIFNLKTIIEKCREFNNDLYICFIDYSKAFDCIQHEQLWHTMEEMNFPKTETKLIKALYQGQQSAVRTNCGMTKWFPVRKGVRQGCILSPYLFNIYTESIMRDVEGEEDEAFDEFTIQGRKIKDLRYADDTALLSSTASGLINLIGTTKKYSEEKGLMLNVKKTKIMKTDKTRVEAIANIDGEQIENVDKVEYLGAIIQGNGDGTQEVRRRLAMGIRSLTKLQKLWKGSNRETQIRVIRSCVFPTATYGCEAWTLNQAIKNSINAFEMKCYRKMLRIPWTDHRTNDSIRREIKIEEGWLLNFVIRQKIKYFGHIKRHQGLEKTILEGRINGKRGRGRPRRQWVRDITDTLKMTATEAGRLAERRDKFREATMAATSHKGYAE